MHGRSRGSCWLARVRRGLAGEHGFTRVTARAAPAVRLPGGGAQDALVADASRQAVGVVALEQELRGPP
jgi:hypothetical protein